MVPGYMSLMTGLAGGFERANDRERNFARMAGLDKLRIEAADRDRVTWEQDQAERQGIAAAAAPVAAQPDMMRTGDGMSMQRLSKPETMDDRDVGLPGETASMIPSMRVLSQRGLNPMQAQAAAAAANTPEAIQARQVSFLRSTNPAKAFSMEATATRVKAEKLDLANKQFDGELNDAAGRGWSTLIEFTNKSGASPSQHQWVPTPDGKRGEVNLVQPDGTLKPTGMVFDNDGKGALEAAAFLSKSTPVTAKLQHIVTQQDKRQALDRQDRQQREIERHNREWEAIGRGNTLVKAAGTIAGRRADHFTEKEWDDANKIEQSYVSFEDPNGGKGVESVDLRNFFRSALSSARSSGDMAPHEAAEEARTALLRLREKASEMAAASRKANADGSGVFSKGPPVITEQEAVRKLLKDFGDASTPKAPAAALPRPSPVASPQATAVPVSAAPIGTMQGLSQQAQVRRMDNLADAPARVVTAVDSAGAAFDAARVAARAAQDRLQQFGSMQRAANPQGFAAAQGEAAAAAAARDRAEQEYKAALAVTNPPTGAAFGRYARP